MSSIELKEEEEKLSFKGEDISPNQDEGLMKEIVRQSLNNDKPLFDDEVFIHYIGRELDGTIFINSRDRDEKFSFSLGKGEVIPAWDIGVATMKRGEIARFFSIPKYAYGSKGEKKYRSATNVIFEIELLDFNGKDLSDDNDKSIIRRIIHRGEGRELPNEDGIVEIKLKGIYQENIFDERIVQFVIGLGFLQNIPFGIEHAVCKMLLNEHCQLILKGKALQGLDKFSISMDKSVEYEVILIKFERLEEERLLNDKQKFEQAELLKKRADDLVKNNYYEFAIKRYQMVSNLLSSVIFRERDEKNKLRQLKIAAQSNLGLCYLKLNDYLQCKKSCDNTLTLDPKNEKALFRRGQVQIAFSNYELAIKDFQLVLNINPSNIAAQQQLQDCYQRSKQHEIKQKESYQAFFNNTSKTGLFQADEKYEKTKEAMQEKNALRSLGLEPVNLDSLKIREHKTSNQ